GLVEFLDEKEAFALVAAPDLRTWVGRRDRALLLTAIQTGLRNSELTSLRCEDVQLGTGAHVRCMGKGRKMRCTPLRPDVSAILKPWLTEQADKPGEPVFPSSRGGRLSADAFQRLVVKYVARATRTCPSLGEKPVTPHTLRHTAAMSLLRHGVDLSIIALWLGHESVETTQIYLHADMRIKEQALSRTKDSGAKPRRYRPPDPLLAYLERL
ncbi:MAG: tyrosine-type recombinase/integrase, partial [Chloroflexota bacterium]